MPVFFATVASWLGSAVGKFVLWVTAIVLILGTVGFLYYNHNALIRSEATAAFNVDQLHQQLTINTELLHKKEELEKKLESMQSELSNKQDALDDSQRTLQDYINKQPETKSSQLLKDTIRKLQTGK
jgi:Skp family chaperone for outer membrane proteins